MPLSEPCFNCNGSGIEYEQPYGRARECHFCEGIGKQLDFVQSEKDFRLTIWGEAPKGTLKYRKGKVIETFILEVVDEAYQRGLKDGYQKYIDEDKKAQEKLLRGFGLPLESQQAIKKFYKGDKHD